MTFTLRFEMISDWHVGAGFGRPGNVDRLLVRDADGVPFLPAKTVRGMWRDAAERIARAFGGGWPLLVDDIFGSQPQLGKRDPSGYHANPANPPRDTALIVTPARLPRVLRGILVGDTAEQKALRNAVSFVKPGLMIETASGRAKDEHLRFEEMGRAGTVLTAEAEFDRARSAWSDARFEAAKALTLAATKLITRIGGKRRRGAGKCKVTVTGADVEEAIRYLEAKEICPDVRRTEEDSSGPSPGTTPVAGDDWVSVALAITLRGPVAVPARTVGNVVETLDFVPGTFLLPHVTRTFRGLGVDARPAIARGDIRVFNATIDVNGQAGRPVPMAVSRPKGMGFDDRTEMVNGLLGGERLKPFRDGYVGPDALPGPAKQKPPGRLRTVPVTVGTHNVIEDGPQRPTEAVGGVYSFQAIAPRDDANPVVLRTELRLRAGLAPAGDWWRRLKGPVRLGSSKKDDYGEAVVEVTRGPEPVTRQIPDLTPDLFVWLLSEVLLRDDTLRPEPTIEVLRRELERRLKVGLVVATAEDGNPLQFARDRRTESWHTGWGLPRPSLVGLQAGSCVRFKADGKYDAAILADIEASGLGERTAEGFGQVRFNDRLLREKPGDWKSEDFGAAGETTTEKGEAGPLDETSRDTAKHIEDAAWREAIRVAALGATADEKERTKRFNWTPGEPNSSQLGGLRAVVQFLRSTADRGRVTGWLDAVRDNRKRAEKWPRGSLDQIRQLVTTDAGVWEILQEVESVSWPTLTPDGQARLKLEHWAFAVRALLDAAVRAHKRAGEEVGRGA